MEIRVTLPRVPAGLFANLAGLFGLAAVAVAVGGLTSNYWWSVLVGGVFAVFLAAVAQAQSVGASPVDAPTAPIRAVETPTQTTLDEMMAREQAIMRGERVPAGA